MSGGSIPEASDSAPVIRKLITYLHLRESVMDTYLKVLELESEDISGGDAEKLTLHAQMEQELLERMEALQKVITGLYHDTEHTSAAGDKSSAKHYRQRSDEEQRLEQSFNEKCDAALDKNRGNQENLKRELGVITQNLKNVRRFQTRAGRSAGGSGSPQSRFIDIET